MPAWCRLILLLVMNRGTSASRAMSRLPGSRGDRPRRTAARASHRAAGAPVLGRACAVQDSIGGEKSSVTERLGAAHAEAFVGPQQVADAEDDDALRGSD